MSSPPFPTGHGGLVQIVQIVPVDRGVPALPFHGAGCPALPQAAGWVEVAGLESALSDGGPVDWMVGDRPLVFLSVEATLYAFDRDCPICGASLGDGRLELDLLRCSRCDRGFDPRQAGASVDGPGRLEPVPLIAADGTVRVVVGVCGAGDGAAADEAPDTASMASVIPGARADPLVALSFEDAAETASPFAPFAGLADPSLERADDVA